MKIYLAVFLGMIIGCSIGFGDDLVAGLSVEKSVNVGASLDEMDGGILEGILVDKLCPGVVAEFGMKEKQCTAKTFKDGHYVHVYWDRGGSQWQLEAKIIKQGDWKLKKD